MWGECGVSVECGVLGCLILPHQCTLNAALSHIPAEVGRVLVSGGVQVHQEEPQFLPGTVQCLRKDM